MLSILERDLLKIKSGSLDELDALCQSIIVLMKTDSPFQEKKVSFEPLRRYNDLNALKSEAAIRLSSIESILKPEFDVTAIRFVDAIRQNDFVHITFDVITPLARREIAVQI